MESCRSDRGGKAFGCGLVLLIACMGMFQILRTVALRTKFDIVYVIPNDFEGTIRVDHGFADPALFVKDGVLLVEVNEQGVGRVDWSYPDKLTGFTARHADGGALPMFLEDPNQDTISFYHHTTHERQTSTEVLPSVTWLYVGHYSDYCKLASIDWDDLKPGTVP